MQTAIRVVIAFECGRLGNQLFQYAAIKAVAPRAFVLIIGMKSLSRWLGDGDCWSKSAVRLFLIKFLRRLGSERLATLAGRHKPLSLIQERISRDASSTAQIEPGWFPWVAVFRGYFQEEHIPTAVSARHLAIHPEILAQAREWMTACTPLSQHHCYFIHVRRGDYVRWPSPSAPAVLSASWYQAQVTRILSADPQAQFFVVTDDIPYVNELFPRAENFFVSTGSEERDLATMTLCHGGGILSASSFSWWGAYYSHRSSPDACFIAPAYWAGWRENRWLPGSIKTSWLHYVQAF